MRKFYYKFPTAFYAYGPIEAQNEREARARIREAWKLSRLPNGFEVWETEPTIAIPKHTLPLKSGRRNRQISAR